MGDFSTPSGGGGNSFLCGGTGPDQISATSEYLSLNSVSPAQVDSWKNDQLAPNAFRVKNLYVQLDVAPGAGKTRVFEIYDGAVATGVKVTISDTDLVGNDLVNTYSFAAADTIRLVYTTTGTPGLTRAWWGVEVEAL